MFDKGRRSLSSTLGSLAALDDLKVKQLPELVQRRRGEPALARSEPAQRRLLDAGPLGDFVRTHPAGLDQLAELLTQRQFSCAFLFHALIIGNVCHLSSRLFEKTHNGAMYRYRLDRFVRWGPFSTALDTQ